MKRYQTLAQKALEEGFNCLTLACDGISKYVSGHSYSSNNSYIHVIIRYNFKKTTQILKVETVHLYIRDRWTRMFAPCPCPRFFKKFKSVSASVARAKASATRADTVVRGHGCPCPPISAIHGNSITCFKIIDQKLK